MLFYEDLCSNPQAYLDTVCDFVGARRIALDRSAVGSVKVYSAPGIAGSGPVAGRLAGAVDWAARHGARPLIKLGQSTPLWKILRRPFIEEIPPMSQESADEIRAIMLPEIEELEQITGRDLSHWKSHAAREINESRVEVRSQTG